MPTNHPMLAPINIIQATKCAVSTTPMKAMLGIYSLFELTFSKKIKGSNINGRILSFK